MNIIILPYAGVPSYYFFIDQGQYLAQSLVVVKKKKKKKKTGKNILQQKDCRYLLTYIKDYICYSVARSLCSYCLLMTTPIAIVYQCIY